jgi:hypothetical protein
LSTSTVKKDIRRSCDIPYIIIGMQAKEFVAPRLMPCPRQPTHRKFTCRRTNPACVMTRERDERNRYDLPGWQEPFPGPFHARFNRVCPHSRTMFAEVRSLVRLFMAGRRNERSRRHIVRPGSVRSEIETFANRAV